jgi:death-on-curing protein
MMALRQLSREDLLEIHRQQVDQYGGQHGVRDWTALDRVVHYAATERTPASQAATLLTEIIGGHPFHSGNKRCGANAALVAMLMNGRAPLCSPEQLVILIHALDMREIDREGVERFFADHSE